MATIPPAFKVAVLIAVTLTGGGFGSLAGIFYSADRFWWAGMVAGGAGGFCLAWSYLRVLARCSSECTKGSQWLAGTATAVGCGIACTLLVHGVMILLTWGDAALGGSVSDVFGIAVTIGLVMGAGAGFVVGGICSLIYVCLPRGTSP